jgi:hypothetical protein
MDTNVLQQMRADWIREHFIDEDELYRLNQYHSDERVIACPMDLILPSEMMERVGYGYVCPDGAWYDPCTQEFSYVRTIEY